MKARYDEATQLLTLSMENSSSHTVEDVLSLKCVVKEPLKNNNVPVILPVYDNKKLIYNGSETHVCVIDTIGNRIIADDLPIVDGQKQLARIDESLNESLLVNYTQVRDEYGTTRHISKYVCRTYNPKKPLKMTGINTGDEIYCVIENATSTTRINFDKKGIVINGIQTTNDGNQTELNSSAAFKLYIDTSTRFKLKEAEKIELTPLIGCHNEEQIKEIEERRKKCPSRIKPTLTIQPTRNIDVSPTQPKNKIDEMLSFLRQFSLLAAIKSILQKTKAVKQKNTNQSLAQIHHQENKHTR